VGVALAAVLLSVTLGFLLYHSRGTRASARAKDNPIPVPAAPVPPPATLESPLAAAPAVTAQPKAAEPIAPAAATRIPRAGMVVQVGAMTHEAYADALVKELKQKNLPAFVFRREGDSFYRVAVGPFTDRESPAKVRGELEKQGYKPFLRPWAPNQQ
jgi:cell division septation protein DedD